MITRRIALRLLLGSACIPATAMAPANNGAVPVAQATRFIHEAGDRLIAILDAPGDGSAKREQLKALIGDTIDVTGIARFTLGRFWTAANDDQRAEYMRLFPAILAANLGKAFGNYRGVRFTIDHATAGDDLVQVTTTVLRPDYTAQVTWVVGAIGGETKIIDVIAGGFSLRISQRDDCASLLRQCNNSVAALIETLRHQAAIEA